MTISSVLRGAAGLATGLIMMGGVVGAGVASAAPAPAGRARPAGLSCTLAWHDTNTAGIKCFGGPFIGAATCKNGRTAQGAAAASGTTSYAYCSSFNSSLVIPVVWSAIPA